MSRGRKLPPSVIAALGPGDRARALGYSDLEDAMELAIRSAGLPASKRQHQFCPERRWRFDHAWPGWMVAVEVQGGLWTRGRHTRGGAGAAHGDAMKLSTAAAMGWRVLSVTPEMIDSGDAVRLLAQALSVQR